MNSIVEHLKASTNASLYVDDFQICFRSKQVGTIERHLQQCLNNLQQWADQNGFRFSTTKTVCVHFCKKHCTHSANLFLNDHPIPVVKETKFLGMIFDQGLTFKSHIEYLKKKCQKALNLLRVVSSMDWGADRKVLLRLYRSLIRSKLDYGCIVYGTAAKTHLQKLDPVQNSALRICTGAFRSSPTESLSIAANEPPLQLRRIRLGLQYALKLKSNPSNPAHVCSNPNSEKNLKMDQGVINHLASTLNLLW